MWASDADERVTKGAKAALLGNDATVDVASDTRVQSAHGASPRRPVRDVVVAVLFAVALVAHVAVSVYSFVVGDPARLVVVRPPDTFTDYMRLYVQNAVAQLKSDGGVLALALVLAVVAAAAWVQALKYFTRVFLYVTLYGSSLLVAACGTYMIVSGATGRGYLHERVPGCCDGCANAGSDVCTGVNHTLLYGGIVVALVGVALLCVCLFVRKRIELTAAMFQEACKALQGAPAVFVCAFATTGAFVVYNAHFVASLLFLYSVPKAVEAGTGATTTTTTAAPLDPTAQFAAHARYLVVYQVFMCFWVNALLSAVFQFVVAGAVGRWYFARSEAGPRLGGQAFVSMARALSTSLGTLALGALLIALVQTAQYVLRRAKRAAATAKLRPLVWLLCCVQATFASVEGLLKYVDRWIYIWAALYGQGFCGSAKGVFNCVAKNSFSAAAVDMIGRFVLFVGKLALTALVAAAAFVYMDARDAADSDAATALLYGKSPVTLAVVVVGAYLVANLFAHMLSVGVDTVFVAYLIELEEGNGENVQLPQSLKDMLAAKRTIVGADGDVQTVKA